MGRQIYRMCLFILLCAVVATGVYYYQRIRREQVPQQRGTFVFQDFPKHKGGFALQDSPQREAESSLESEGDYDG